MIMLRQTIHRATETRRRVFPANQLAVVQHPRYTQEITITKLNKTKLTLVQSPLMTSDQESDWVYSNQ